MSVLAAILLCVLGVVILAGLLTLSALYTQRNTTRAARDAAEAHSSYVAREKRRVVESIHALLDDLLVLDPALLVAFGYETIHDASDERPPHYFLDRDKIRRLARLQRDSSNRTELDEALSALASARLKADAE